MSSKGTAKDIARRILAGRYQPLFPGETRKRPGDVVITNVGRVAA